MSTFKVYSSKNNSAKNLGKQNALNFKLILILLPVMGFVIALADKIFHYRLGTIFWIIYVGLILIVTGYSLILINNLKQIGTISFSESRIIKRIGDLSENIDLESISGFTVKTHIRDLFFQKNKFGIRTYYLEVQFLDKELERYIVSSTSTDKPEYGLREILTTLSKTKKLELKS